MSCNLILNKRLNQTIIGMDIRYLIYSTQKLNSSISNGFDPAVRIICFKLKISSNEFGIVMVLMTKRHTWDYYGCINVYYIVSLWSIK